MKWAFSCFQVGPLFLSFPPYKVSQFATPFTCRHVVVLKNLKDLVVGRKREVGLKEGPKGGGFRPGQGPDRTRAEAGILTSFVNWPNFISRVSLGLRAFRWMLDGYVARRMGIDSVVSSYLDPLAYKVLIGSVALAMVHMNLLHRKYSFPVTFGCYCSPSTRIRETQPYVTYLSWLVASTTMGSTAAYGVHEIWLCCFDCILSSNTFDLFDLRILRILLILTLRMGISALMLYFSLHQLTSRPSPPSSSFSLA